MLKYIQYFLFLSTVYILSGCGSTRLLQYDDEAAFSNSYYIIDSTLIQNKELNLFLFDYKLRYDSLMKVPIGTTSKPLTKAQPDCTLGYLVADALLEAALKKDSTVHAAISNQGGIRVQYIPPGTISLGQVYEIMPFDNLFVVIEVPGTLLLQWLQHIADWGGWPVSGISFEIYQGKVQNVLIQGIPLHPNIVYRIATSDYIANGGDQCAFLLECKRTKYNVLMRETIIDYIKQRHNRQEPLAIELENRIRYVE